MKRTFAYGAATSKGAWPVQEDGYFADPVTGTFGLADGFGGRGAGDMAARQALQDIRNASTADRALREGGIFSPMQAAHRDLFGEINKNILQFNEKRPSGAKGGCSLLLAAVEREGQVTVTGCGAGAAFLIRAGAWLPLLAPQASPRGDLTEPLLPAQALGLGRELSPESRSFFWRAGDLLLLFSSGLAWERDGFAAEFNAQLALREPGGDLGALLGIVAEGGGGVPAPWNQTVVAVEALASGPGW